MVDNKTFGVVSCFVKDDEEFKSIAIDFLAECWKLSGGVSDDVVDWDWDDEKCKPIIPLFLCETRADLKRNGAFCPYEFIIERCALLPDVDDNGHLQSAPIDILASRLRVLKMLYGSRTPEEFASCMRDWLAGTFRLYMLLDSTTHGLSEFIDLKKVRARNDFILKELSDRGNDIADASVSGDKKEYLEAAKTLFKRFKREMTESDAMYWFQPVAKRLFGDYFESVVKAIDLDKPEDRLEALCNIYCDTERKICIYDKKEACECVPIEGGKNICSVPREHKERLPLAFGDRAKYVTSSGKVNMLLIDDKVKESPFGNLDLSYNKDADFCMNISQDDWDLLQNVFNVQTLPIDSSEKMYDEAACVFRRFQEKGLTFDLILVDLCLGNNRRGDDLAGYTMIQIVRVFFPGTPVVVYSRFSDMEHIARAFANGAKWFLIKGEEAKLPRHVLKLLKQVGWHREWRAIENSAIKPIWDGEKDSPFFRKFMRTPEWQYLTYKSLEFFPGRFIAVKQMGGGISTAVTFKATKGVKLGDSYLQTPSIIKIDTSFNTMMEYERYFRMIRPYIANEAGRVEMPERELNRTFSSIVYTFAGKQDMAHTLESLGNMLGDDVRCETACDYETYRYALNCIFEEILPKIHRVSPELELGDIGRPKVLPSDVKDAFALEDTYIKDEEKMRRTSFPNFYFDEFLPSEFWKSYMLRMQPWGRINIAFKQKKDGGIDGSWPFCIQKPFDLSVKSLEDGLTESEKRKELLKSIEPTKTRLIFHSMMSDPFETTKGKRTGKRLIEAYTQDWKMVWLDGDVCDFVARFRKRVTPGTSLWLEDPIRIEDVADWRLEWLKKTFEYNKDDNPTARNDFVKAIGDLLKVKNFKFPPQVEDMSFYIKLQDAVIQLAQEVAQGKAAELGMKCPIGIIHGDLNVGNIMLESRKHPPKEDDLDITKTVSDVWLIDFARTRRDLIAHDFNVFFTSILGELFTEDLIGKDGKENSAHQKAYWEKLVANFSVIVSTAVDPKSNSEKGVPDEIKDDQRFTLIYRILRRTHDAATKAGVSQNMYLLTTALSCLLTVKIFLNNGCKVRLAAGYFAAAWICYDMLCKNLELNNEMDKYKK